MTAWETLTAALISLRDRDQRTPCQSRHRNRWTSDDAEDREWAAAACRLCPLVAECAAAAEETRERHYVWAGVDRTARPTKRRAAS